MPYGGPDSERALILSSRRRDAEVAAQLLKEASFAVEICTDIPHLLRELVKNAGFAVITEELIATSNTEALQRWISEQPAWSDFPIILLTGRADTPSRIRAAQVFQHALGNVTFLERPFHPTTLVSLARSALRSRHRQYDARELLERHELLAFELQHRTKNLLSVILSIASASLREGGNEKEAFVARLHALAKAQDIITDRGDGGALLEDVVRGVLESFGSRISIEGPKIYLKSSLAQGFALVVHELTTNAAKHGALIHDTGTVLVRWSVNSAATKSLIHFKWQERGGPPPDVPKRKGFGTVLLERAVASSGSPPRFDYAPEGLTYELSTSLPVPAAAQAEQPANVALREAESRGLTPKAAGEALRTIARKMSGRSTATKHNT